MTDLELIAADFDRARQDLLAELVNLARLDLSAAKSEIESTIRVMRLIAAVVKASPG